jgi:Spy/CpxP family protein refolding chaperone
MSRRVALAGLALAVACALAVAATARAQVDCEGGPGPEMGGPEPAMGMLGFGGMGPGLPPGMPGGRGARGPMMGMQGPGPGGWEGLGLSEAQRRRLDDLRDGEQRQVIRLEADLRIAELDLRKLVEGERLDLRAIGDQVDRIADLRADVMKARLATRVAMREVLTPGQRAKLRGPRPGARPGGGAPPRPEGR